MKPFTRELISDRRQPALRWSAIFAGVAVAIALWSLLQILGMGIGLTSIDVDDAGSLRHVAIGNGVWSLIVPLIALAAGGFVAGKLAATYEQRVGAMHGLVVGALSVVTGLVLTVCLGAILDGSPNGRHHGWTMSDHMMVAPSLRAADRAEAVQQAGAILLGAGISLLVGIGAAIAGGALATRAYRRKKHDTAEVPVVPPPAAPPADAPHVG
jgi:MFS family permease